MNFGVKVIFCSLQSSTETIQAPPFYHQVAGTVILCDVMISVTSSYSSVTDLDLSCRTLYDNTLPPATPEQLGELSQNLQFISKIGSEMVKLDLDLTFESETSEVTSNNVEIQEPISQTPIVNLVFTATSSSSYSSSISSSSSRIAVRTSSSSCSSSSSLPEISSSFFAHHSSSLSSSSSVAPIVCDGCNCPREIQMNPDDSSRTLVLESPDYPHYYPNDQSCMWTITATYGQLHLLFSKFSVQSDPTCSKDYLQISGPIKKYRRARICGFPVIITMFRLKILTFCCRCHLDFKYPLKSQNLSCDSSLILP